MSQLLSQLTAYLRAVFIEGTQKVFTLFDALGILLFFLPHLAESFQLDSSLARNVGGAILLLSFLSANFALYRRLAKDTSFEFETIKVEPANFSGDIVTYSQNRISIQPTFLVHVQAVARVAISGSATSVRIFIESVSPNCLAPHTSVSDIEVALALYQQEPHRQQAKIDNPYYLRADEMQRILIRANIPLELARLEESLGSLSALTEMTVVIAAEQPDHRTLHQIIKCDLMSAQKSIEQQLAAKIQHAQNLRLSGDQFIEVLRRYYRAGE